MRQEPVLAVVFAVAAVVLAAPARSQGSFLPGSVLALGDGHALVVEKETEKLLLFEGQPDRPPRLVRVWNATTGQNGGDKEASGDHRTPEGIYFFTEILDDHRLPAEYGVRALVMDYPNLFDRRAGKTGHGIWLHATDEIVRPLTSKRTRGCVVVTNRDILELSRYVRLGRTPIVVEERLSRLSEAAWQADRKELLDLLERWRRAWSGQDLAVLRGFYAPDFAAGRDDRASWVARRRDRFRGSPVIDVAVRQPTVLRHGDEAIVRFGQAYLSDRHADYGDKTLWLERRAGAWRIVSEDWRPAEPPPEWVARLGGAAPAGAAAATPPPAAAEATLAAVAPRAAAGGGEGGSEDGEIEDEAKGDGAASFAVRRFLADAGRRDVRVSFRLEREPHGERPSRGHLAMVVKVKTPGGDRLLAWPPQSRLQGERPANPGDGDPFQVRRFKLVEARLDGLPKDATLDGVSVFVYDDGGRLVRREDFGR